MKAIKKSDYSFSDQDQVLESLRGLIQIDSTSQNAGDKTEEAPLGERIAEALNYVLQLGEEFGFRTKNLDNYSGWLEIGPEDSDEMIAILTHIDTVPVSDDWSYDPYDLTIEDGKMYGRGTLDDKGPTIAALYAMKAIKDSGIPLDRRVRMIVGGDEENGDWMCMERYKQTEEMPTYAFSPDGDYPVIYAEKGILHLEFVAKEPFGDDLVIESGTVANIVPDKARAEYKGQKYYTEGLAAHAMEPEKGDNALLKLGQVLRDEGVENPFLELLKICSKEGLDIVISDEPSGELTYNPAVATLNSEEARLVSDIRYPVTLQVEDFIDNIRKNVEPLGFEVNVLSIVPPLYVDVESELVQKLVDVYRKTTGDMTAPIALGGGTYARAFDNAVAFGILFPGEDNMCHKTDEYWSLEDLNTNMHILADAIAALAKTE